jgi:hypothetical protein
MRIEPFDAFDRFTEQLASERRSGRIHSDAYIRDHGFKAHLDLHAADESPVEVTA